MNLDTAIFDIQELDKLQDKIDRPAIRCVDLFCGVGGLTHGLIKGGIQVVAGVDIDPQCRFPYESNNNAVFVEKNVSDLSGSELAAMFGDAEFRLLSVGWCRKLNPISSRWRMFLNS